MQNDRPDPDHLLAEVKAQEAAAQRGRLRIYFGASAGVGKTYAMLEAGRKQAKEGLDVVVEGTAVRVTDHDALQRLAELRLRAVE